VKGGTKTAATTTQTSPAVTTPTDGSSDWANIGGGASYDGSGGGATSTTANSVPGYQVAEVTPQYHPYTTRQGDTITGILQSTYGQVDPAIVAAFWAANPGGASATGASTGASFVQFVRDVDTEDISALYSDNTIHHVSSLSELNGSPYLNISHVEYMSYTPSTPYQPNVATSGDFQSGMSLTASLNANQILNLPVFTEGTLP
jgi:phage tail protein X